MPELNVSPICDSFGVEVRDLDIAGGLDNDTLGALAAAFIEHKFVVVRDQRLTPQAYVRFAFLWGEPRNDAYTELSVPGFNDLSTVGNSGGLLEEELYRNGSAYWHTDCAAEPNPDATTMLYCVHAPHSGGETILADMQRAYDALDEDTRREIDPLVALHCYSGTEESLDGREAWEYPFPAQPVSEETMRRLPSGKKRPLVRRHSVTGRKGLYAPAGSIVALEGMETEPARTLVRRLKLHATSEAFCYRHRYRVGDILLWDNTVTLHRAAYIGPSTGDENRRLLYRIVPTGVPKALRQ